MPVILPLNGTPINPASDQADGLVAHWPLNDNGTTALDSLQRYPGTITGATSVTTFNGLGRSFNGSSNFIDFGNQSDFYFAGPFSFSVNIVRLRNVTNIYGEYILSDYIAAADRCSISLLVDINQKIQWGWENPAGTTIRCGDPDVQPLNTLINIVCTWDGGTKRLYVNGVLKGTNNTAQGRSDNGTNLALGRAGSFTNSDFYSNVIANDLRIYNRALSESEILDIYDNPNGLYAFNDNYVYTASSGETAAVAITTTNPTVAVSTTATSTAAAAITTVNPTIAARVAGYASVAVTTTNPTIAVSASPLSRADAAITTTNPTVAVSTTAQSTASAAITTSNPVIAVSTTATSTAAAAITTTNPAIAANIVEASLVSAAVSITTVNPAIAVSTSAQSTAALAITTVNPAIASTATPLAQVDAAITTVNPAIAANVTEANVVTAQVATTTVNPTIAASATGQAVASVSLTTINPAIAANITEAVLVNASVALTTVNPTIAASASGLSTAAAAITTANPVISANISEVEPVTVDAVLTTQAPIIAVRVTGGEPDYVIGGVHLYETQDRRKKRKEDAEKVSENDDVEKIITKLEKSITENKPKRSKSVQSEKELKDLQDIEDIALIKQYLQIRNKAIIEAFYN